MNIKVAAFTVSEKSNNIYCHRFSKYIFLSLQIDFVLANSVDPDKVSHYAYFHLNLHCYGTSSLHSG